MSNAVEITLNGKTFKLGYGMEVFLQLGELWGFDTLEQVNERFQVITKMGGKDGTSLKDLKTIAEILEAMTSAGMDNVEKITAKEILCIPLVEFQDAILQLTNGFVKNMPQGEPETEHADSEKKKTPAKKKIR
jgi:hypothetical protein